MTPEEVQLDYQIALQARADMAMAPDEYAGFTMAILRMLAFKPAGSKLSVPVKEAQDEAKVEKPASDASVAPWEDAPGKS